MEKQSKQAGSLKVMLVEKLTNRSHMSIPIQDLTPAIPFHKETKKTLSARLAFRHEAGKKQASEVCIWVSVAGGARIRAPLPQVWEFVIKPEHMHVWEPLTRPVTGFDRPLQAGDRVTLSRRDFFRNHSQILLVEKVVPYHSLHLRNLAKGAERRNGTATLSVEEAKDREATWMEFALFYSLGSGRVLQWLDRLLINPTFHLVHSYGSKRLFWRSLTPRYHPRTDQEEHKEPVVE